MSSLSKVTDWFGFDTENDDKGRVTLAALIHEGGKSWVWESSGHLGKFIANMAPEVIPVIVCHNLEYDLINEFGHQMRGVYPTYLKGKMIIAKYGKALFLDSGNHFRMPLAVIGEEIGITKGKLDIHSREYVVTDAQIALTVMTRARDFISAMGGEIGVTSGSSAVSLWKAMGGVPFLDGPYDNDYFRSGYSGGRTEIFRMKVPDDEIVRGYDINSMYPTVMLYDYPVMPLQEDSKMRYEKGMATVTIDVPTDLVVAPLVYRDKTNNRLIYPVGHMKGTWTYDEIRFAESVGAKVRKVHEAYGSDECCRPFTEFITTLYDKRKQTTDRSHSLFLKVMMNSLYGKLASKNEVEEVILYHTVMKKCPHLVDEINWVVPFEYGLIKKTKRQKSPYVNVMWGAMVTAYSRILLTKYLMQVPPDDLVYADTDSIYCINFEFQTDRELGGMKLEKERYGWDSPQLKVYRHGDFYRAKGVPRPRPYNSEEHTDPRYIKLVKNKQGEPVQVYDYAHEFIETGRTTYKAPIRFKDSLRSKRGKANQWVKTTKGINGTYDKKRIRDDWRCLPPIFGEQFELGL